MPKSMLDWALYYSQELNWPIFPCRSDKTPYVEHGVTEATTDSAQVERWWRKWPKANIGLNVGDAGMMVLDHDVHKPEYSREKLVEAVGSIPETKLRAMTPRGGLHEYFALGQGEIVPNSASKLAPCVDVRSFNGYVLLPPSRTSDGSYEWLGEGRPAHRSDKMFHIANTARQKASDRDDWIIDPDLEENVDLCVKWLREKAKISIEGQGGEYNAYATAAMCRSFGISEAMAFDLIWEHWNPRCSPPWSADEADHLETKVRNAYAYHTSPPGNVTPAYRAALAGRDFKPVVRDDLPSGREATAGRFRAVDREGMRHIKPARWLVRGLLPQGGQSIMFGAPGTFKTFVALDLSLGVCVGYPEASVWSGQISDAGPVAFIVGEGRPELTKRVRAWESEHWGGQSVGANFVLLDPVPNAGTPEEWDAVCDLLLEFHPRYSLVVTDTIGRSMAGLNENQQQDASRYSAMSDHIRRRLGDPCHLGLHHTGLDHTDRERGSNVFGADADTRLRLDRAGKDMLVRLHVAKQKDGVDGQDYLIKLKDVELDPATERDDAVSSLAAVIPDKAAQFNAAEQEARKEAKAAVDKINWEIIDSAVIAVLEGNKATDWTTKALALEVSRRESIGVSASTLQNRYLPALAETKEARAFNCFQSKPAPRWRWVSRGN